MSVDLSMTMTAAVPRPEPTARRLSKSIGASQISAAGTSGTEEPPGITASRVVLAAANAAAVLFDQFAERDRHGLFDHARLFDMAADLEQLGALVVIAPEGREPGRRAAGRGGNRDRFHVVDRGRAADRARARGERGLRRGWPFLPSIDSIIAVSSPQM